MKRKILKSNIFMYGKWLIEKVSESIYLICGAGKNGSLEVQHRTDNLLFAYQWCSEQK